MNHDGTHCGDYVKGKCPDTCYRAQMTQDFEDRRGEFVGIPTSWASFKGTPECRLTSGWIVDKYTRTCSSCGRTYWMRSGDRWNYCPECGAKMEEDSNGI